MNLAGTPSDLLPAVLATGETQARYLFVSFSGRHPEGRDAEYIAWHSLDHRPEQHRLPELKQSLRLVSTPECRATRAASEGYFDQVDHVMNYLFTGPDGLPGFADLGGALMEAGRMPIRLPSISFVTAELDGKSAAPSAVAGADVIPWRPATGVYLIVEQGQASPASLLEVPGVAGIWWYRGALAPGPYDTDARGMQLTYCYLEGDPVEVARAMRPAMEQRWEGGAVRGLLASSFHTILPFAWDLNIP